MALHYKLKVTYKSMKKKTAKIVTNYFPTKFDKYNYNLSNSKKYLTEQSSFS